MLESFFNNVAGPRPATLLKRDSKTGAFLLIFLEERQRVAASVLNKMKLAIFVEIKCHAAQGLEI